MQVTTLGVGDNPLRGFGAAQGVVVEEFPVGGNIDSEDVAASGSAVRIEERENLLSLERPDLSDGEAGEVDREFEWREDDIAGDRSRISTGGTPWAVLLGRGGKRKGNNGSESDDQQRTKAHSLRMTSVWR